MPKRIKIEIPGVPIAKARPKFARRGRLTVAYDPQEKEKRVWVNMAKILIDEKLEGPLFLKAYFCMPRAKSHYGTGKNSGKLKKSAPQHHVKKPDLDNMIKWVCDCLNGIAYHDDAQIIQIMSAKWYSDFPCTQIELTQTEE